MVVHDVANLVGFGSEGYGYVPPGGQKDHKPWSRPPFCSLSTRLLLATAHVATISVYYSAESQLECTMSGSVKGFAFYMDFQVHGERTVRLAEDSLKRGTPVGPAIWAPDH